MPPQVIDEHERVRAYEIAAYLSAASFPFHSPEGPPSVPVPSSDITLNALVQHGAHKMDCDRAFLSLIDNQNQFICAEMTRHQSLSSADPTDPLLLGTTRIALEWGVCPYTMSVFHGRPVSMPHSPYIVANESYFCIKDFRQIPTFAERPFVAGYPYMVSYIEIPLFAMSGHILGSYCVVDNKERDFLHPKSLSTMREVTSAISSYLDMKRGEAGKSRSARMMRGLGRFIASDERHVVPNSIAPERPEAHTDPFGLDVFSATTRREPDSKPASGATTRVASSDSTQTSPVHEPSHIIASPQDAGSKAGMPDLSIQARNLFVRAADNIGNAMDLDGIVFFDTVSTGEHRSGQLTDTIADELSPSSSDSFATPLSYYQRDTTASQQVTLKLSQSLIQRLTTRYTRGHVFAVDEHGVLQHGGEDEPDISHYNLNSLEDDEWTDLFKFLPKTRAVIFLPMWHYQREACYATCLAWVSDTGKTLDTGDVNSLTAFGNSIMAKIFRLEASANTQSKSDFVSTISHELRSPLHGILASIELIQESSQGTSLMPEITMIESCALTLLDTFDHLLEFSKVNSRADVWERGGDRSTHSTNQIHNGAVAVDLASMVEDVIETVSLGHEHSSRLVSGLKREDQDMLVEPREMTLTEPVILTTHIERGRDWTVVVEKGAWRRILLNVVSNALKYTRSGYIQVDLGFVEAADDRQSHISLSVTDTGVGMSQDFLKYDLFTPFTQENILSPGTGLGLSLVKSIVESLHGRIFVFSRLGEGTKITINIPISQKMQEPNASSTQENLFPQNRLRGKTVGLLSLSPQEKSSNQSAPFIVPLPEVLKRSIRNICEDRFGMIVTDVSTSALPAMDIVLVDAHALDSTATYDLKSLLPMYTANVCPVVIELGNTKGAVHKIGHWKSMHTMLVTGKSLESALITALEDTNTNPSVAASVPPINLEGKLEINSTEQLTQHDTIAKVGPHIETVALPHRGPPLQNMSPAGAATIPAPQPQSTIQSSVLLKHSSTCRFRRLLLVDDNPINLKMLCAFAKRLNVPYSSATDGAEAVRLYQTAAEQEGPQTSYDCIFMDINMPVMDGFQAVSRIRRIEDEWMEKIVQSQLSSDTLEHGVDGTTRDKIGVRSYIFALTGLGSEKARRQARSSGFDEFLLKPVRFKDVLPLLALSPTP